MQTVSAQFNPDCKACPRLSRFLHETKKKYPGYYAKPVPAFGDTNPKLLIVGLAPGMHGANASGRPFTGDYAGVLLYEMLFRYGFSNKPVSESINDGLKPSQCRITNAVKCLPPENKPTGEEINNCNRYLSEELKILNKQAIILCLGRISHRAVIKAFSLKQSVYPFQHGMQHKLENGYSVIDSYHCSRYNTQTKRLTKIMFDRIFKQITSLINCE